MLRVAGVEGDVEPVSRHPVPGKSGGSTGCEPDVPVP